MTFVDIVNSAVILAASLACIGAVVSGGYILWIYRQRFESALFLDRLVNRDLLAAACGAVILAYLALALSGYSLGKPWGAIVIGVPGILLLWGPTSDALLWRKERRK
jgi:hypothetical protein